jgi:hypothetical protein
MVGEVAQVFDAGAAAAAQDFDAGLLVQGNHALTPIANRFGQAYLRLVGPRR